jgi:DNA-directed RNA polymerase beta subunit
MSQSTKPTVKRVRKPAAGSKKAMAAAAAAAAETVVEDTEPMKVSEEIPSDIKKVLDTVTENITDDEVLAHLGNYIEEPFTVLESYFHGQHLERLVRHQIESYNHFINYQMQKTIQMFNPVMIRSENDYVEKYDKYLLEISISFQNFKLFSPQIYENNGATKVMFPQEAKLRNFTYASTMTVDVKIDYIIRNTECMDNPRIVTKVLPKINIGKMPIMLKSSICVLTQNKAIDPVYMGECPMDCGGYFIIKGSEKTVLGQERAAENRVYCFDGKNTTKWSWYAEIKSIPDFKCISPKQIEMMIASKNNGFGHGIFMNIPRIKQPIELFVVFRALGITTDRAICEYVTLGLPSASSEQRKILEFLQASVIDANKYMTQEDALRHIAASVAYTPMNMDKEKGAKKKLDFTNDVLHNDMFPHCKTPVQKLYMIGYMCQKLIQTCLGWRAPDDRDSYVNKRIELTGTLLNNLFRNYFNKLVKEMQKQVVREINNGSWRSTDNFENIINMTNIYKIMKSTTIENGINRALATGDFSIKQSNSSKVGVAQVLNRLTYLASLSHSRRINTPLEKSGELIAPRKLHNTTWGFLCCLTGDTEVLLSNRIDTKPIRDIVNGDGVSTVNRKSLHDEPASVYNFFSKMPDKLYEITTLSGRTIKATGDHPFLVNRGNQIYEMVNLDDMCEGDNLVIRHMVKPVPDQNKTRVVLDEVRVPQRYRTRLLQMGLLNTPIPLCKLKIIARWVGIRFFGPTAYVNEHENAKQLVNDLKTVGFNQASIEAHRGFNGKEEYINRGFVNVGQEHDQYCYMVLMQMMGGDKYHLPDWLIHAEPSIQRQFLSAFICDEKNNGKNFYFKTEYTAKYKKYMQYIVDMLWQFNIKSHVVYKPVVSDMLTSVCIVVEPGSQTRFDDLIQPVYNENLRREWAEAIELRKIREFSNMDMVAPPNWSVNGCVSVPIVSIREIPPELVYDFTVSSDNHSFVASSFVVSNCAETPEGQSIGVVKNISYMAHITIPTNSVPLYDYILPKIQRLEDLAHPSEAAGKVRVFINGAWVGVTEQPQELYEEIKDKKFKGIINIYTSVVFDCKNLEIRVCNDGGRLTRPLLKVRNQRALLTADIVQKLRKHELTWNDLLVSCRVPESVIEYIDPEEQNFAMIAMKTRQGYIMSKGSQGENTMVPKCSYKYTHCEIHPSTVFGVLASCIPFPDHNQSPRNTYQCLAIDEEVWCADGSIKSIKDVDVGNKVLTFHPTTLAIQETRVVNHFVIPNLNKVYELTTVHGKRITATLDHNFMTDQGWKTVEDMQKDPSIRIGMAMRQSDLVTLLNSRHHDRMLVKNNCLFAPIQTIVEQPNQLISCIETESENHSFITTHGFLSKNCCMGKQALGVYALNYDQRMDKTAYVLAYPSRPLVDTRVMNFLKINRIPSGHQITVAIMAYTAYNQEDSLLINKGSIDRGLFMTTVYHTEKDEDKNIIRDEIIRCKPDPNKTRGIKYGNYDKLNTQGFIAENTLVENRDVIIAKTVPIKENRNDPTKTIKYEDQSKTFRTTEECYVDKNYTGRNGDGYNFAKVRIRTLRKPVLGDKFSSRAGQKGTCGLIIPEQDMPYTKNGLRPDIILNPHAIPSRMTIGQLKETVLGKVLLELGMFGDGTSFGELDVPTICRELQKLGYESYGNEVMYNGYTGEQLETSIFIGPVYYQRLKHMVNDKQHSRSIGPMVNLTRQPAEGRSRDGGFRIGEMERDVMIAHGISRFCRERLYDVSDKYMTHVCGKCGMIACYNEPSMKQTQFAKSDMSIHLCRTCNNTTDFAKVEIPYAYKLLAQELQTINIVPRILTE